VCGCEIDYFVFWFLWCVAAGCCWVLLLFSVLGVVGVRELREGGREGGSACFVVIM
jgi:hypothetical protein